MGAGSEDRYVRFWAAMALGCIGSAAADAVPALVATLSDSAFGNRMAAARALARIGRPAVEAAVPALADLATSDDDHFVRKSAVEALGRFAAFDDASIDAVGTGLDDPNVSVRAAAVSELRLLGGRAEPTIPALQRMLSRDHETDRLREDATRALATIESGASVYRRDEPYRTLSLAAESGRFSDPTLLADVQMRLDSDDFEAALRLLEARAEAEQEAIFWLELFNAARELDLHDAGRYYERYLEISGVGGYWHELETVIHSNRTPVQGMRRVIKYCGQVDPDPRWRRFNRLPYEADLARLQTWLQTLLASDPPPAEITALWLGLVNLDRDGKPTLDMYVSGERHSGDPAERVIGGSWRPRGPYAKSGSPGMIVGETSR